MFHGCFEFVISFRLVCPARAIVNLVSILLLPPCDRRSRELLYAADSQPWANRRTLTAREDAAKRCVDGRDADLVAIAFACPVRFVDATTSSCSLRGWPSIPVCECRFVCVLVCEHTYLPLSRTPRARARDVLCLAREDRDFTRPVLLRVGILTLAFPPAPSHRVRNGILRVPFSFALLLFLRWHFRQRRRIACAR